MSETFVRVRALKDWVYYDSNGGECYIETGSTPLFEVYYASKVVEWRWAEYI